MHERLKNEKYAQARHLLCCNGIVGLITDTADGYFIRIWAPRNCSTPQQLRDVFIKETVTDVLPMMTTKYVNHVVGKRRRIPPEGLFSDAFRDD